MESDLPKRTCWLCLGTDEDDQSSWLEPCRCLGSSKWIHQKCLEDWIDSKLLGDTSTEIFCPQCNAKYVIVYPPFGMLAMAIDVTDHALNRICRLVSLGVALASSYWTAATFGAISIMEVLGLRERLNFLNDVEPITLSISLPAIPVVLVLCRLIKWDNFVLKLWRNYANQVPIIKYFVNSSVNSDRHLPIEEERFTDILSDARVVCGALILPTIASLTGSIMFRNVEFKLGRAVQGGIAYLTVKGMCKLYLRQQHYQRLCQRRILNYWEMPREQ